MYQHISKYVLHKKSARKTKKNLKGDKANEQEKSELLMLKSQEG